MTVTTHWLVLMLLSSSRVKAQEIDGSLEMNSTTTRSDLANLGDTFVVDATIDFWLLDGKPDSISENHSVNGQQLLLSYSDIELDSQHFSTNRRAKRRADDVDGTESGKPLCRVSDGHYLPIDLFSLDTCARCYRYIPDQPSFFHRNAKWNHTVVTVRVEPRGFSYNVTFLMNRHENLTVAADLNESESAFRQSFASKRAEEKWESCCTSARDCCQEMLKTKNEAAVVADDEQFLLPQLMDTQGSMTSVRNETQATVYCPPTWDGWTCWRKTPANRVALAECPHYIYFETEPPACSRYAEKACTVDGTWYRRGDTTLGFATERTNYIPCSPVGALKQRTNVHVIAYAISTAALVPALLVFYSYRQLNVYRIRLHKNMFISILLNSILVIVFQVTAILPQLVSPMAKDSLIKQNAIVCRLIMITLKYLRLTNYMWMFCEGFYLHRLIAAAFAEQNSFAIFYFIGWVFPLLPTGIYAVIRGVWHNDRCWVEPIETWEWVLNAPSLLSLVVNMVFLVNIIRILVMKLRSAHSNEPSQYRKAVRATLVLVPLFGLHFVVTIYRPSKGGCEWIEFYHYVNALLDGLQGCLVAIIFCYGNGEVHYLIKRSYRRFKEDHCLRSSRNNQNGMLGGGTECGGGAGGVGCSVFLGRSNGGSTTHFSLADCSPNPHQKQISMTIMPILNERNNAVARPIGDSPDHISNSFSQNNTTSECPPFRNHDELMENPALILKQPLIYNSCVEEEDQM